ncbi:non-lysosomal glucosylceramidase [Cylas formicarius]|uniref:non-lysosomal glucosylceramidase n=1 Tax=Cylas formicarius TaxID=197179 RepID=UPI0029588520|nr:non-lysosomal glucosylceramidase [Cylas formicarius]
MTQNQQTAVPKYGFKVKLDHEYPVKCTPTFKPSLKIIWGMLPLILRYLWYYVVHKIKGKSIVMDYVNLQDSKQIYGVPIGGIGSGSIGRGYKGEFCRFQLKPDKCDWNTVDANQFIVTIKDENHKTIFQSLLSTFKKKRLRCWQSNIDGAKCTYTGLYPRSWTEYDLSEYGVKLICRQVSPVIPHEYEASCLPCAVFVWNVENVCKVKRTVTIAFTFKNGTGCDKTDKNSTCSTKPFAYRNKEGVVLYHTINKIRCTYTLAVKTARDVAVSQCLYFDPGSDGSTVWDQLAREGQFDKSPEKNRGHVFGEMACGVAAKTTLTGDGGSQKLEMALVWDMPVIMYPVSRKRYYKYYTERFGKEDAALKMADYALDRYKEWESRIFRWQGDVLDDGALPGWFKAALFNETYFVSAGSSVRLSVSDEDAETFEENDPRRKYGRFAYLEGLEYRMYNSYDVHFYASHALSVNWPELQRCLHYDLRDFVYSQIPEKMEMLYDGAVVERKKSDTVPHDAGDPGEAPFLSINAYNIHDVSGWRDLNPKFVLQTFRDANAPPRFDRAYIDAMYDACDKVMTRSLAYDQDNDGLIENSGFPDQTFDTWVMSGASAYCGGLWLAALYAMVRMSEAVGKTRDTEKYSKILNRAKKSFEKKLWNGRYYNFDCSRDHAATIMADQLNGHWYLCCAGAGHSYPILPRDHVRSALKAIFENNVVKFCDGAKGAVNGSVNGAPDTSTIQSQEVWTGVTYALAATMIFEGMTEEGFRTAGGMIDTLTCMYGFAFDTPEALYASDHFRSVAYMRPLSVWSMYLAWKSLRNTSEAH